MMLHDVVTGLVLMLVLWAIISPKMPTGVFATAGLGVIFGAGLWSLDDWAPGPTVVDAMLGGIGLIGLEAALHVLRDHLARRRARKSQPWGKTQPLRRVTPNEQRQVAGGHGGGA
jgi:hypothetical protein